MAGVGHAPLIPGATKGAPLRRVDHGGRRWLVQFGPRAWVWVAGDWVEAFMDVPAPVLEAADGLRRVEGNGRDPGGMQIRR